MIRVGHIADLHVNERGRLADVVEILRAFVDQITAEAVDLVLVAGDCFERKSSPAERAALADFLQAATDVAPVVVVKGNHDQAGDLELFARLQTARPLLVFERPTAAPGSAPVLELGDGRSVGILAVPWFDKAQLVAGLEATVDAGATRELTIAAARELLVAIGAEASRLRDLGAVPVLVAHVLVGGSEVSTGQVLIGTTVELAPHDLTDTGAAYVALGHVHKAQAWLGGRVAYAGSPHRCNFGEPEAKGFRLVTLTDAGELVSNEFRELPARRMVLLEADWSDDAAAAKLRAQGVNVAFALGERDRVRGALVRFRARVRAQDLAHVDEAAIERVLQADGAAEVKVEVVVVTEARVRSAEIVRATSTAKKVDAYLATKRVELDEAARSRILAKLAGLEAATHHDAPGTTQAPIDDLGVEPLCRTYSHAVDSSITSAPEGAASTLGGEDAA